VGRERPKRREPGSPRSGIGPPGRGGPRRRSVGVAAAGVGVAWAVHRLVAGVAVVDGVLVGAVVAVAGAVLLLVALRG
jgi:hypothetical protein